MRNSKPLLLVEDDDVDAMTVTRAFTKLNIPNEIIRMPDGEAAADYLQKECQDLPCLIITDINMPRMDGIEFLTRVKSDTGLKAIPVLVLTTSREQIDVMRSFTAGAAGYMIKPVDYTEFVEIVRTIENYWQISELPTSVRSHETAKV
jgi:CheY-like chemotaxis protein